MKTKLGLIVCLLLMLLITACDGDDVDDCSIPQEVMDNPPTDAVPYTLYNQTCTTISTIYVTPKKCGWWGISWMGKEVLHPKESYTAYVSPGKYDVHFEDATGIGYFQYNQRIRKEDELVIVNADGTSVDECQASVTLVNQSDKVINGFYIHSNGGLNWLGSDVIMPGESFQFLMYPDTYDLMVSVDFSEIGFDKIYDEKDVLVDHHIVVEVTERNQ